MFNQNIKNKHKIFPAAIFLFTIAVGFGFINIKKVSATSCQCYMEDSSSSSGLSLDSQIKDFSTEQECIDYCKDRGGAGLGDTYKWGGQDRINSISRGGPQNLEIGEDVCEGVELFDPTTWINCLLIYILQFLTGLLSISASLFKWIIDAKNITDVLSNSVIYTMWMLVRDVLNISFILVLLFSAFCTVFQIEKYNYKKILLTLIIMALLVNFSFPISRVIIDFSNVIMYYLIKTLNFTSNSGSFFVEIARNTDLGKIVYTHNAQASTPALIAAVIFTFILAVTLLIIAILFFIRIIALAILIIFSSVAFVGSIVPFLSSQAGKWWDALFKYSFFGPIMIFMIIVATKMMSAISSIGKVSIQEEAFRQSGLSFVSDCAFFAIPIVILWIGIGFAQSMSIAGASAVVGRGQRVIGWAGRRVMNAGMGITGINFIRRQAADYSAERRARAEQARFRWGRGLGRQVNEFQDTMRSMLPRGGGAQARLDNTRRTRNREEINNRVQNDGRDGNTLINDLDINIDAALDPNTVRGDKRTHAVTAQALRNLGDTELQNIIDTNITTLTTGQIFAGAPPQITASLAAISGGTAGGDDYRRVIGYLRTRAGQVQQEGIRNG